MCPKFDMLFINILCVSCPTLDYTGNEYRVTFLDQAHTLSLLAFGRVHRERVLHFLAVYVRHQSSYGYSWGVECGNGRFLRYEETVAVKCLVCAHPSHP